MSQLYESYPWTTPSKPIIVSAPMMKISLARYALSTSEAGGIGFLAGGFDVGNLKADLAEAARRLLESDEYPKLKAQCFPPDYQNGDEHKESKSPTSLWLPIGVGVQNWGADLDLFLEALRTHPVHAVWFFAPKDIKDLGVWTDAVRTLESESNYGYRIQVWVQVGSVAEAREVLLGSASTRPDVLVVQGGDAGGHGLLRRAGIISLLPEIKDLMAKERIDLPVVAAGGVIDGRGTAAALALGADGVCMGTRLLASPEAIISKGYQDEVLRANDGGVNTIPSTVYDRVRGIRGWPKDYAGRGVINQSFIDAEGGMSDTENEKLYQTEMQKGDLGWGPDGRMTTYAGTGVGLVNKVMSIGDIVRETQDEAVQILKRSAERFQSS